MSSARRKPVLIVQHAQHEHPATIRRALETQGIETLWIHSYLGEPYPQLSEIRGMISLGGPMGANDEVEHPWIKLEIELLRQSIESDLPTVGLCLGGQMMARALGSEVIKSGTAEVGWHPLEVNTDGLQDRILGSAGATPLVYHWHYDTFLLPQGASLLAKSDSCPRQAYRVGEKAYGFQFHPEADHHLVNEWLAVDDVPHEINQSLERHGRSSVQGIEEQKQRNPEGETSNLKITTAIGQLFQKRSYSPIQSDLRKQIERGRQEQIPTVIEFEDSNRKLQAIAGTILLNLSIQDGEFIFFKERQSATLWPIRLDLITSLKTQI